MRDVSIRLLVDHRKKGMAIGEMQLLEVVRDYSRRHPALLRPYQKTKISVQADDGSLWFVFCFLLLTKGEQSGDSETREIVEVVDCVPAQRTKQGRAWFSRIDECYDVYGRRWRAPVERPPSRTEMDLATLEVEHLLESVEAFTDSLPGGQAMVADIGGLSHLLHDGRQALYDHLHNLDTGREAEGYYLELCLWHIHEFVLQIGNRLGFTRSD